MALPRVIVCLAYASEPTSAALKADRAPQNNFRSVFIRENPRLNLQRRLRPNARYDRRARWALPVGRDLHLSDHISVALNQQRIARRTISILPSSHAARQVAGIDISQTGLTPYLQRAN